MIEGLNKAASALGNGFSNMGRIANNLANVDTPGFKRDLPFSEVLDEENNIMLSQFTDHHQGDVYYTNNPLDLALTGQGFFTVDTGNEVLLTKNGKFKISEDGYLVNSQGYKVLGQSGEISVGEYLNEEDQKITVTKEGEIIFGKHNIDTLKISVVGDLRDLTKAEASTFRHPTGDFQTAEETEFSIAQGYLENSNINPVIEMEAMIQQTKDYETAAKIIQALDTSLGQANEIGKV